MRTYSIRPEREAHALLGISAGGYGAMAIALKHRDLFGAVATLAGPLNMRYDNCRGRLPRRLRPGHLSRADRVRPRHGHRPLLLRPAPAAGQDVPRGRSTATGPGVIARIGRDNPADLLDSTDLRPGELAIYVNYPGRDNYNFDAQDQSFAWLAASRGVAVDADRRSPGPAQPPLHRGGRARPPTAGSAATSCRRLRADGARQEDRKGRYRIPGPPR